MRFAGQAALALDLGDAARRAASLLQDDPGDDLAAVFVLVRRLDRLSGDKRKAGLALVAALDVLLRD